MVAEQRDTGIKALGTLSWGSHICVFYGSRQDLVSILVPYFKAGLQNNEFCLWITSPPLGEKEVISAMSEEMPDLNRYLEEGQMIFISHEQAYLKDGFFNEERISKIANENIAHSLRKGYDGFRCTGDLRWLKEKDWANFTRFEAEANNIIADINILALCAYPLDICSASEFVDVMSNHRYAFIVQDGDILSLRTKTVKEMSRSLTTRSDTSLTPLMKKFAVSGLRDFRDEETIELFLSLCLDHRQKLPLPRIISRFKNIRGLLAASPDELRKIGLDSRCIQYVQLFREIPVKVLEDKVKKKPIFESPKDVFDYLYYSMRDLKKEVFKAIYLNAGNQIIGGADLFEGVTNRVAVNAREVIQDAIASRAKSLIFVHNHPSGDPTPSKADRQLTRDLVFVGNILQIRVLDHIIIGDNTYFSFAHGKLIQEYETDFLNLKLTGTTEARFRR